MSANATVQEISSREYPYGFVTDLEADTAPRGLNEDVIRMISAKKNEPSSLGEQERLTGVAVDAMVDPVSVGTTFKTTFKKKLAEVGVIFCSFSEAVEGHSPRGRGLDDRQRLLP